MTDKESLFLRLRNDLYLARSDAARVQPYEEYELSKKRLLDCVAECLCELLNEGVAEGEKWIGNDDELRESD